MASKKRKIKPIKPAPYTGLMGARQAFAPRNPTPHQYGGSSTSVSQGGIAPQEEGGGGIESLMAGKEAYDQMGEMYQSGEDLQKGILGMPEKAGNAMDWMGERYDDITVPITDWWNDTNTLRSFDQLPQGGAGLQYPTASGSPSGMTMGIGSSPAQNTANMYGLQGSSSQLGSQLGNPNVWAGGSSDMLANNGALRDAVMQSGDVSMATQLGPTYETLDGVQVTGQGLQNTSEAATAANAAEASFLSKAGALAGLGLNAYDMFDQGVTANNAMGLLGSGIMAGTTMLGLSNAWNPLGWGLLGASAVGGLTDWW